MPQRFLRPGIRTSDAWNQASWFEQSLYIRLLTLVDDEGRYDGRIAIVHAECFALRDDVTRQQTAAAGSRLSDLGLLEFYEVDGKPYLQLTKWQERVRNQSRFPGPEKANRQPTAANGSQNLPPSPVPSPSPDPIPPYPHTQQENLASLVAGQSKPPKPPKANNWHPTPTQQRLNRFFNRRDGTKWSDKELKALKDLGDIDEGDFAVMEAYYTMRIPEKTDYRRRDMLTLLNNWPGELDRAKRHGGVKSVEQKQAEADREIRMLEGSNPWDVCNRT